MRLANKIVDFISSKGNHVGTEIVIEHFQGEIKPVEAPLFRQILQAVAKLKKKEGGGGKEWQLKPEFANAASSSIP